MSLLPAAPAVGVMTAGAALNVSVPFNAVSIVALGLFSVRSTHVCCFFAICALVVYYLVTELQKGVGELDMEGFGTPELRQYLIYGLGRWISDDLFSAFLARAAYNMLPRRLRTRGLCIALAVAAVTCFVRETGTERSTVHSVTKDPSIRFYFHSSVVVDSIRAGLQVAVSGVQLRGGKRMHMLAFCVSVLIQNAICLNELNILDVILQVSLILYTICLCPVLGRVYQNLERHQAPHPQFVEQQQNQAQPAAVQAVQEAALDLNGHSYTLIPIHKSIRKYYPLHDLPISPEEHILYASSPVLVWPDSDIVPYCDPSSQTLDYVLDLCADDGNLPRLHIYPREDERDVRGELVLH